MNDLNLAQEEAILHLNGPALVIAGAGSGKTRVVTHRIAHLIQEGVHPSEVLGLTFTNKAALEMKERVQHLTHQNVLIATFHSLGARILRQSIESLGYLSNFAIYDEDDSEKLLIKCLIEKGLKEKKGSQKIWRRLISTAKNDLKEPEDVDVSGLPDEQQSLFPGIYREYNEALLTNNAVDFDDLLFLPIKLLKEFPNLKEYYQNRWKYLLIDEYQDTNPAQYALVNLLVEKTKNLFVVGDPDQAIYSWRGANIYNILNFEKDYPGAKVIRLEQNYRSRTNILEGANSLIQNNETLYHKRLWSDRGEGAKIGRFSGYSEKDEARFISARLKYHHDRDKIAFNQMVVFYRTNAQSRPFEDQFLIAGIPYRIVGGISFYQRKEIKDLLSFLRLIVSDSDTIAFARVLNIPKRGIGESTLSKLLAGATLESQPIVKYCSALIDNLPLGNKVALSLKVREGLFQFIKMIHTLRAERFQSLKDLLIDLIDKTNYLQYLKEDRETYEERKENIDELIAKTVEWDLSHAQVDLDLFLEELSLKSSLDEGEITDRVQLMTVHNGKGLEFAVAVVAGLEEDLFPHVNSRNSEEQLQEERRLCYVGMTRAKDYLYLTDSQVRYIWGVERFQRVSRFIREIPASYLERYKQA